MSWLDPQRYSLPVVVSIALHGLIILLFLFEWPTEHRVPEPVPQHVIANIVQTENKTVKKREEKAAKEKYRQQQAAKREAERKKKIAAEKRKAKEKALKEKQLADKRAKEAKAKAEKEKADKAKAEKLAKERAQQEEQLLEQLAQEQAAAEQRAQEEAKKAAAEAARQAEVAAAMKADATTAIRDKVQSVWQYPPAVTPDLEVEVHITLVPTGQVIDVRITKGSGNAALDRSVQQAIRKASPLPVPKDPRVFEQSFRQFTMKFRPENATW